MTNKVEVIKEKDEDFEDYKPGDIFFDPYTRDFYILAEIGGNYHSREMKMINLRNGNRKSDVDKTLKELTAGLNFWGRDVKIKLVKYE
jgi:hypothetical protein